MLLIGGAILVAAVAGLITLTRYVERAAGELPDNRPELCGPPAPGKTRVVLLGDSLTLGRMSASYETLLRERPEMQTFEFINAGINSELAWNLLQRVDHILSCNPQVVLVLVGCNDINALATPAKTAEYMKEQKLPRSPAPDEFASHVLALAERLKGRVSRVAFFSPSVLGEDLTTPENERALQYAGIVRDAARRAGAAYLPLQERQRAILSALPLSVRARETCAGGQNGVKMAAFRHFILRQSWEQVARANGMQLLTDCLHLNPRGAALVADLAAEYLLRKE